MTPEQRLGALCALHGLSWAEDLATGRVTLTERGTGRVVGVAAGPLAAAVATHESVLAGVRAPAARGAIEDAATHPLLVGVAHRTKRQGPSAPHMLGYLEAAAQDPHGRAVRVWMEIGPDLVEDLP